MKWNRLFTQEDGERLSVNTSGVLLLVNTQTSNIMQPQNYSPPSDVSAQLKDDILLSSANTGHYCSVTPAPPWINPCLSACLQQVTWTLLNPTLNSSPGWRYQQLHVVQTIFQLNHLLGLSDYLYSLISRWIHGLISLTAPGAPFLLRTLTLKVQLFVFLYSQLLISSSYPHLCSHPWTQSCIPRLRPQSLHWLQW